MINYIIQVILFQALFLMVYDFILSKETFFVKNRWYLLITSIVAFVLPFIKIASFQKVISSELSVLLPEIILSPQYVIEKSFEFQSIDQTIAYVSAVFWLGILFFSCLFVLKLGKLIRMIRLSEVKRQNEYTLVLVTNTTKAFSFFNFIFLGNEIDTKKRTEIIEHELIHSQQKHSLDLLFFEILKIVMWFNPLVYVYQKRITLVHEYLSDESIVRLGKKEPYINNLLSNLFDVENISFVNQFYKHSYIKKRIRMILKTKSNPRSQLKYLLLLPMLVGMLFYSACVNVEVHDVSKNEKLKEYSETEPINKVEHEDYSLLIKKGDTLDPSAREVLFVSLDKVPTFPGCPENDKKCFNKNIQKHFAKNFNSDLPNELGLKPGKKRIIMFFKIDREGDVIGVRVKAPHKELEKESIRIISLLPKMIPGEKDGEIVTVKYTLPMRLDVEG
ncbi:MAG: energy transducer TonB [Flavobacteriaceae bacterium]|nr:energy transducer TonB [Flavobacteriaceae bacterium]